MGVFRARPGADGRAVPPGPRGGILAPRDAVTLSKPMSGRLEMPVTPASEREILETVPTGSP
jgi:hypothetical protein